MNQPLRQTTAALIARAASDFQAECNRIAALAHVDGEVPVGTRLDLNQNPPVWVVPEEAKNAE